MPYHLSETATRRDFRSLHYTRTGLLMSVRSWSLRRAHALIDGALRIPPDVVLNPAGREGPSVEDALPDLREFLAAGGVDYRRLEQAPAFRRFCDAVASLHRREPPASEEAATAWWINLYNALVIHAVVAFGVRRSVWEDRGFFRHAAYVVAGQRMSADDIEHGVLRGNRPHPLFLIRQFSSDDPRLRWSLSPDPRVHFALVCASRSCPAIRLYTPARLGADLDRAASAFINGGGVIVDPTTRTVSLSPILKWYRADFGGRDGVRQFILRYFQDATARDVVREPARVRYLHYDWTLNALPG